MLRSVKYGAVGAVAAGVVGGIVAFSTGASAGTPVTVVVDGHSTAIHTHAKDVQGALKSAGLAVGPHDIVAPAVTADIRKGSKIVLNRGRLLKLTVDGSPQAVWTTARTVDQALAAHG
jgi:uncharacterized protein YabE (DUF348 family)